MSAFVYSKYFNELQDEAAKKRYEEKMKIVHYSKDPFCELEIKHTSFTGLDWNEWPDVLYADIYNYLILTPSEYTHDKLKAYKSLDGYNYFVNGWVSNLNVTKTSSRPANYLFLANVKHSQSLSSPSLKVWVAFKASGEVLSAHCTCMAGLGEACSHIAAVLFTAEANTRVKSQFSSTSLPCSWLPPSFRSIEYAPISEIDFSTPKHKRKVSTQAKKQGTSAKRICSAPRPTETELNKHYEQLSKIKTKPVLLALTDQFSDSYIPLYEQGLLPKPLSLLYEEVSLTFSELLNKCESIYHDTKLTADQVKKVEEMTREQANCKLWFQQRCGRVTASKLRTVLHTNYSKPSKSLLQSICYPVVAPFYSKACAYGCEHEDTACKAYMEVMGKEHNAFKITKVGLVLDANNPFIGASPDGLVECLCCGKGTLEIKCPYSCREQSFEEVAKKKSFCLEQDDAGHLILKKDHDYYHQVQLQMKLCKVSYSDFVVWSNQQALHQRIFFDAEFIESALTKVELFVKQCILPELIGKWFTNPNSSSQDNDFAHSSTSVTSPPTTSTQDEPHVSTITTENTPDTDIANSQDQSISDDAPSFDNNNALLTSSCDESSQKSSVTETTGLWCYCKQDESFDYMIGCDNQDCPIQWFHLSCVQMRMEEVPEGEWFCPECQES